MAFAHGILPLHSSVHLCHTRKQPAPAQFHKQAYSNSFFERSKRLRVILFSLTHREARCVVRRAGLLGYVYNATLREHFSRVLTTCRFILRLLKGILRYS